MPIIRKRFIKGLELTPTDLSTEDLTREGELALDESDSKLKYRNKETFTVQENSTDDTLEINNHSFVLDDKIVYQQVEYFVINPLQNSIQLSSTSGGSAIDILTDSSVSVTLLKTKEVLDTISQQTVENKTIDATAATGNNTISADSSDILYDDTVEAVKSLLKSDGMTPVENAQEAIDSIKRALDGQDNASEIDYTPANGTDWVDPDPTKVDAALDQVASRITTNEADINTAQSSVDNHISNTTGAHEALAISNSPSGNLTSINVQDSLVELQLDIDDRALADGGTISNASIETPSRLDVKQDTLANLETYAMTASDGQIVFATDEQKMFQVISNELQPIGGGGSTSFEISQSMHGFSVGNGIYHNGTSWVEAQADDANTLAYYIVIEVKDTDNFIAADFGRVEVNLLTNPLSLVAGQYYFLSDSVAGQPTSTEPSTFSNPLFYIESIDTTDPSNILAILQVKCLRPEQVGANTTLDQLSDVSASTPNDKDILTYDSASQLYVLEAREVVQTQVIDNNASVAINLTNLILDGSTHRGYKVVYNIYRNTDTNEVSQTGTLHFAYKNTAATWQLSEHFAGDDSGVTFEIDATGQVKYTSSDLLGTSYSGTINYKIQEKL